MRIFIALVAVCMTFASTASAWRSPLYINGYHGGHGSYNYHGYRAGNHCYHVSYWHWSAWNPWFYPYWNSAIYPINNYYVSTPPDTNKTITTSKVSQDTANKPIEKAQVSTTESIAIDIPNKTGGYISVKLTKVQDGYVGPQGEHYAEHPTVDQLKVLYGK